MKQIFLTLTLLFTLLPAHAIKKFEADPINIAAVLVEKSDSANVASTLAFYGYTFQTKEDGYTVMRHPNGNEIRFSFNTVESKYPTIRVKTKGTRKSIDSKLIELDFVKTRHGYEKIRNQYSKYKTSCTFGPHGLLIFQRLSNQKLSKSH